MFSFSSILILILICLKLSLQQSCGDECYYDLCVNQTNSCYLLVIFYTKNCDFSFSKKSNFLNEI